MVIKQELSYETCFTVYAMRVCLLCYLFICTDLIERNAGDGLRSYYSHLGRQVK